MAVASVNITIEQGEDFSATYTTLNPDESIVTLTNYSAAGTLRKHPGATTGHSFTTNLNVASGTITISLSSSVTKLLTPGRYYYDLFLIAPGGLRSKAFEGNALVNPSATLPT